MRILQNQEYRKKSTPDFCTSIPIKKPPPHRRRDAYLSKEPIEFVGFLATPICEMMASSTKKITLPMRTMKPSDSPPAIGAFKPITLSP